MAVVTGLEVVLALGVAVAVAAALFVPLERIPGGRPRVVREHGVQWELHEELTRWGVYWGLPRR